MVFRVAKKPSGTRQVQAGRGSGGQTPPPGRPTLRGGRNNPAATPYGAMPAPGAARGRGARGAAGGPGGVPMDPAMMAAQPGMENQMALSQVYMKYQDLKLTPMTEWTKLKDVVLGVRRHGLVGSQYRYRLRLGVLNPVAGTDQVAAASAAIKNQTVLRSPYSDATQAIDIRARQYFSPRITRRVPAHVDVEVSASSCWDTGGPRDLAVRPGEAIGREMETKPKESRTRLMADPMAAVRRSPLWPTASRGRDVPAFHHRLQHWRSAGGRVTWRVGRAATDCGPRTLLRYALQRRWNRHPASGSRGINLAQQTVHRLLRDSQAEGDEGPREPGSWSDGLNAGMGMGMEPASSAHTVTRMPAGRP